MDPIAWLLESDPSIRWQTMRDLTSASPAAIAAERARVAHEGLGAEILARQAADGAWRQPDPPAQTPAWLTTLFTMLLLRAAGADPADSVVQSAMVRLETGVRWNDRDCGWELRPPETGGNTFFQGEVEPCINGGALALGAYFGRPNDALARRLLAEQLSDGGWNCEAPKSAVSSFHTTICVLEGLLEYERAIGPTSPTAPQLAPSLVSEIAAARQRGHEYLLQRRLFRRLSTGAVVDPAFLELAFPPRYRYDILRALDYFRAADVQPDPRIDEAVQIVESKRQPDGRWLLDSACSEALAVPTGETTGQPSRWNTLRALRILRWRQQPQPKPPIC
jgi:hypothetical protein